MFWTSGGWKLPIISGLLTRIVVEVSAQRANPDYRLWAGAGDGLGLRGIARNVKPLIFLVNAVIFYVKREMA